MVGDVHHAGCEFMVVPIVQYLSNAAEVTGLFVEVYDIAAACL